MSNWGSYQIRSLPHPLAKAIEALGVTRGPDNLPYPVVDVPGGGNFLDDWFQLGGVNSVLGLPIDSWYSIPGGQRQDFVGGSIYWSTATGTDEVQGAIYYEYTGVTSGPNGSLGFPSSDELGIAGGRVSYFYGHLCGARGPSNSGSAIYWTSTTGAHSVDGCIYNKYWNFGGPNSGLNFPTSDEQTLSGGWVSYFYGYRCGGVANGPDNSGSAIYSSGGRTFDVTGCIYGKYQQLSGPGGMLGYPVSDLTNLYNSSGGFTGWVSYFAGLVCGGGGPNGSGSAIYTPTTSNTLGASHDVTGCIYAKYQQLGETGSLLGYPVWISPISTTAVGASLAGSLILPDNTAAVAAPMAVGAPCTRRPPVTPWGPRMRCMAAFMTPTRKRAARPEDWASLFRMSTPTVQGIGNQTSRGAILPGTGRRTSTFMAARTALEESALLAQDMAQRQGRASPALAAHLRIEEANVAFSRCTWMEEQRAFRLPPGCFARLDTRGASSPNAKATREEDGSGLAQ